jgi:molybdopterin-containing oxidoreductase family membrane subunit
MGEIVDYLPTWVEISITFSVLALGVFVVSFLIRPAIIIEERYDTRQGGTPGKA